MTNSNQADLATLSSIAISVDGSVAKQYALSPTENTVIGRSPDCQIPLDPHEFITVSRRHAEIKLVDTNWQIKDLETTNGTLVNDNPVNNSQQLESGDRITLGVKGPEFTFECLTLNATVMVQPSKLISPPPSAKVKPDPATNSEDKLVAALEPVAEAKSAVPAKSEAHQEPISQETTQKALEEPQSLKTPLAEAKLATEQKSKLDVKAIAKKDTQSSKALGTTESEVSPNKSAEAKAVDNSTLESKTTSPPEQKEAVSQPNTPSTASTVKTSSSSKTLWNLISATDLCQIPGHSDSILALAFSSDGQLLASAAKDKTIKLWNIASQTEIATLTGHKLAATTLVFSTDGKTLASAGADKIIKLWNIANQAETASFGGHKLVVNALAFSPDGQTLASGSADKTIKLWNVASLEETAILVGHKLAVESLAFSPDGKTLASGSKDKTIKLWKPDSKEEIAVLTGHKQGIGAIRFSSDGQIIASAGGDRTIKLWKLDSREERAAIATPSWQKGAIAIAADGQTFAGIDEQGVIKLWQI